MLLLCYRKNTYNTIINLECCYFTMLKQPHMHVIEAKWLVVNVISHMPSLVTLSNFRDSVHFFSKIIRHIYIGGKYIYIWVIWTSHYRAYNTLSSLYLKFIWLFFVFLLWCHQFVFGIFFFLFCSWFSLHVCSSSHSVFHSWKWTKSNKTWILQSKI